MKVWVTGEINAHGLDVHGVFYRKADAVADAQKTNKEREKGWPESYRAHNSCNDVEVQEHEVQGTPLTCAECAMLIECFDTDGADMASCLLFMDKEGK